MVARRFSAPHHRSLLRGEVEPHGEGACQRRRRHHQHHRHGQNPGVHRHERRGADPVDDQGRSAAPPRRRRTTRSPSTAWPHCRSTRGRRFTYTIRNGSAIDTTKLMALLPVIARLVQAFVHVAAGHRRRLHQRRLPGRSADRASPPRPPSRGPSRSQSRAATRNDPPDRGLRSASPTRRCGARCRSAKTVGESIHEREDQAVINAVTDSTDT